MLLPSFAYERPETVAEAVDLLGAAPNARVLAGGQTLLNALKLRVVHPDVLVDVSRLEELRAIEEREDGWLHVGAAVTYDEFWSSPVVGRHQPVAAAMASRIVDRQVRARGTIGGNVCLADPTSNFPPLVVAAGARLVVRGREGTRAVEAEEFFVAPYMTAVAEGELLEAVLLPPLGDGRRMGYESLQVGTDSWALARACAVVALDGGVIADARVALGCGAVPVRQPAMERALIGQRPTPEAIADAARLAGEAFDPPGDAHASSAYRLRMARVMARRAVRAATRDPEPPDA
ncbi:MAG TPA: xanthine dehydrogenase family protein subunit M [Capillimicrobium sp.]